jgi:hypothetical protein
MSKRLREALGGGTAQQIVEAIRAAHDDLIPLRTQVRELELLMARARDQIDPTGFWVPWPPLPGPARPPTLHEAMAEVLRVHKNPWTPTGALTRAIARRGLYRRRDGLPPTVNDVSARISTYPGLFERDGFMVRLRLPPPGCPPRRRYT